LDLIEVIAALEKSKPLRERRFLTAFFGRADLVPWAMGSAGPCWEMLGDVGIWENSGKFPSFEVSCWGICCEMIIF